MNPIIKHAWDLTPREAIALQRKLAGMVLERPLRTPVDSIAGIDVSVRNERVRTAIVVLEMKDLSVIEEITWEGPTVFPYIPGLLSFREIPAILPALTQIKSRPDVLMLDGQGRAHPRRFGLACHLGVLMDIAAIGVAKTRLIGTFEEPRAEKGAVSALEDKGERIGSVVRTRTGVKPDYVSVGNRMSLKDAVELTLATTSRYKIPEPTRLAHHLSKSLSKKQ